MSTQPNLDAVKKEHDEQMARTQNLQGQINGINTQMQELDRKRTDLTAEMNKAATRTVELQGIIKYLQPEGGGDGASKSVAKIAPAEAKSEAPAPTPAPEPETPTPAS